MFGDLEAPEGYIWHSREKSELKCERCGEAVKAVAVDIHELNCEKK